MDVFQQLRSRAGLPGKKPGSPPSGCCPGSGYHRTRRAKIVRDLQDKGFVAVSKQGRCNRYRINNRKTLRHALESNCTVGQLLTLVLKSPKTAVVPVVTDEAQENQAVVNRKEKKSPAEPTPKTPATTKPANTKPVDTRQQGSLF